MLFQRSSILLGKFDRVPQHFTHKVFPKNHDFLTQVPDPTGVTGESHVLDSRRQGFSYRRWERRSRERGAVPWICWAWYEDKVRLGEDERELR